MVRYLAKYNNMPGLLSRYFALLAIQYAGCGAAAEQITLLSTSQIDIFPPDGPVEQTTDASAKMRIQIVFELKWHEW